MGGRSLHAPRVLATVLALQGGLVAVGVNDPAVASGAPIIAPAMPAGAGMSMFQDANGRLNAATGRLLAVSYANYSLAVPVSMVATLAAIGGHIVGSQVLLALAPIGAMDNPVRTVRRSCLSA
jgi:hypothetical protein